MTLAAVSSRMQVTDATVPRSGYAALWFILGAWFLDVQIPVSGLNVGNLVLVAGALFSSAIAVLDRVRAGARGVTLKWHDIVYVAYLVFALLTAAWSPAPSMTIVQVIFLGAVCVAVINLSDTPLHAALRTVAWLAFFTALASFALIPLSASAAFQPATSTDLPELRGIFSHQLRLGLFMGMALGFATIAVLNREFGRIFASGAVGIVVIPVILACLVAAFARLYTAAMVVALLLTIGLSKPGWPRRIAFVLFGIIVAIAALNWQSILMIIASADVDLTLTGRTLIWAKTLAEAGPANWLGYGYASFDHAVFDRLWGYYRPAHPHNSYLQAYFETGYIGLALTLLFVTMQLIAALRVSGKTGKYSYALFLVLFTMIGSLTGSNYAGKPTFLFSITYLVLAIESRLPGRHASDPMEMVGKESVG